MATGRIRPFVAGREGMGRVVEGTELAPGTRVQTLKAAGSMAERFVADEAELWVLPDGRRRHRRRGQRDRRRGRLVRGADRRAAAQPTGCSCSARPAPSGWWPCRRRGCWARAASWPPAATAARLARAGELGADAVVELGDGDLEETFRGAFPDGGPELVIDPLWGAPALAAMNIAGDGMRLVNLGQAAGAEVALPSATVRGKRLRIIGHTVFSIPLDELAAAHAELLGHVRDGSLQLDVETTPLAEAPAAWERQKAGPHTKLVVTP